ncbi:MAG: DUF4331 family protein [Paludisphaera borealis]|uniref:DUF4331 family protein n=1 Tax=Paludisphaera borealis TaxID=1387353 RepID=UPI00283B5F11|nr:DUF4331 family protein [Paludisphaera borealis]MDR3623292.1 DUF4331 family protein [Paludisphaera borealis]
MTRRHLAACRPLILICSLVMLGGLSPTGDSWAADHNDPNAINSIFADIPPSAADLYDMFGFPSADKTGGEKVVLALTFASVPKTGVFDSDLLYKIRMYATPRVDNPFAAEPSLGALLEYADEVAKKYLTLQSSEIRVRVGADGRAKVSLINFPGGSFTQVVDTNQVVTIDTPDGHKIKAYIGGRDDAFFNDLPGFFRSINYAPQFYNVPLAMDGARELKIPKTLIELEGNTLFNFDPSRPKHGQGVKLDLPKGPLSWTGNAYKKDDKGNFRFVYSGVDAQAGRNINAVVVELPLAYITRSPETDRIVNAWGESWVKKASHKAPTIPDRRANPLDRVEKLLAAPEFEEEMSAYKLVDTDGQPFADAALNEREDDRQLGANNVLLARHFVTRLAHLGWGFGPSIRALGLRSAFEDDGAPVSVHRTYVFATPAFPHVAKLIWQELNMPDDSWNTSGKKIPLRRPFEIFVPNVNAIDMDTNGSWPFGRRLEDQVATRFLSLFLDHTASVNGKKYHIELLGDQSLWDGVKIEPKTPPNPLKNDKEFLKDFPYLAEPW